jgi:hypothetical protein
VTVIGTNSLAGRVSVEQRYGLRRPHFLLAGRDRTNLVEGATADRPGVHRPRVLARPAERDPLALARRSQERRDIDCRCRRVRLPEVTPWGQVTGTRRPVAALKLLPMAADEELSPFPQPVSSRGPACVLICTTCLHIDDRRIEHCPACGESAFAKVTKNGDLVSVPPEAGMPCQSCLETERELKLRFYRRVAGMLIMDRTWAELGYFCARCRRKHFARNMAFTLAFGWWGIFAALFRNPYAILVNLWALFRPPFGAGELGAMNAREIQEVAAKEDHEQRLADVYMSMPGWMETLTDDDVSRILVNVDYYEVLGVPRSASHGERKGAWREQVKRHHPDRVGEAGHERIVAINGAWDVLGDERQRYAYDHREELLAFLDHAEAVASEFNESEATEDFVMVVGCVACRLAFASFDDAADHVDTVHPSTDYGDLLISLVDDTQAEPGEESGADSVPGRQDWRCKACLESFTDHDLALAHADRAHPDRVSVDPRSAVEAL